MERVDAVLAAGIKASDASTYTYRDADWGGKGGANTEPDQHTIWVGTGNNVAWKGSPSLADHELLGHGGMAGAGVRDIKDGRWKGLASGGFLNPYSVKQMIHYPDMSTRNAANYECLTGGRNCGN